MSPYAPTLPNGKILEKRRREYRFRMAVAKLHRRIFRGAELTRWDGRNAAPFSKASRALLKFGETALRLVGRTLVAK